VTYHQLLRLLVVLYVKGVTARDASIVLSVQDIVVDAVIVPFVRDFVESVIAPCVVVIVMGAVTVHCVKEIVASTKAVIVQVSHVEVAPIVQNAPSIAIIAKMIIHAKNTVVRGVKRPITIIRRKKLILHIYI